ncbi:MAG: tetratricopeptide repeat protein [Pseudomonadota bacterium]
MESYRTEEEQVEALKRWWDENGRATMVGVVLALGLGFGWQFWQQNQQQTQANASILYQQMLQALADEEGQGEESARELALTLKDEHRGSTYAQFAALHLARIAVFDDELSAAADELRWVLSMADVGGEIHQVAQLRLARVVAAQGDSAGALNMLQGAETDFVASYAQARGDVLLADSREEEALIAFESAVAALDPGSPVPTTLQEKIDYLSARLSAPAAEEFPDLSEVGESADDANAGAESGGDSDSAEDSAENGELPSAEKDSATQPEAES